MATARGDHRHRQAAGHERLRIVATDAMDIHGGKTVQEGPLNYLGSSYRAVPIGITVEGANIVTRSLIQFGQGVIRSHPFLLKESPRWKSPIMPARWMTSIARSGATWATVWRMPCGHSRAPGPAAGSRPRRLRGAPCAILPVARALRLGIRTRRRRRLADDERGLKRRR